MRKVHIEYVSPMQGALMKAALKAGSGNPLVRKLAKVADRVRLAHEPAVNAHVSFRTAQKLRAQGVLE